MPEVAALQAPPPVAAAAGLRAVSTQPGVVDADLERDLFAFVGAGFDQLPDDKPGKPYLWQEQLAALTPLQ